MNRSTGKCHFCNNEETLSHLFFYCERSRVFLFLIFEMFEYIEPTCIDSLDFEFSLYNIILGFQANTWFSNIFNFILFLAKWILWIERNQMKYNRKYTTIEVMFKKLKNMIKANIEIIERSRFENYDYVSSVLSVIDSYVYM